MAGSVNKVILIGHLGKDPEARRLQNGDPVVSMRIATSESWKDKGTGERKEKTEWHSVVCFAEHACTFAESHLRKGMKVYVEGQLQTRKWQDQSGADRYSTEVVINRFRGELTSLEKVEREAPSPDSYGTQKPAAERNSYRDSRDGTVQSGGGMGRGYSKDLDDDIPFAAEMRG